jgi:S1-C subfamily serine protease
VRDIGSRLPGETIRLTVVRGQERKTLIAKLGARPDADTNP